MYKIDKQENTVRMWREFMDKKKENRRVRMTRRLMKDAMLDLLEERDLSGISVTAICEKADVHRSTFYHYYTEPSDLLREIEQDILEQIPSLPLPLDQQEEEGLLQVTTAFFDFVRENEKVFRILFSESVNADFSSKMVDVLCLKQMSGVVYRDEQSSRYLKLFIANGAVGMLREWITSGFPVSSREIAEMMYYYSRKTQGREDVRAGNF